MNDQCMLYIAAAIAGALPPVLLKEYNNRKLTHPNSRYIFIFCIIWDYLPWCSLTIWAGGFLVSFIFFRI